LVTSSKTVVREAVELRPAMVEFLCARAESVPSATRQCANLGKGGRDNLQDGGRHLVCAMPIRWSAQPTTKGGRKRRGEEGKRNTKTAECLLERGRPGKGKSEKRKGDRLTRSRMGRDGVVRKESRQKRVVASSGVQWNFIILRGLAVAFRESPMCPWTNRTRIGPRAREAFRPPNAPCGAVGAGSLACRKSVELLKAKLQLPGACQAWNKPLCAWSHAGNRRRGLGD